MALKERGLATARIGIEERVPFVFASGIRQSASPEPRLSATPVTAGCRMIKSPHEIALMRLANSVTLQAYEAAWKSLHDGMTQKDFGAFDCRRLREAGIHRRATVVRGRGFGLAARIRAAPR